MNWAGQNQAVVPDVYPLLVHRCCIRHKVTQLFLYSEFSRSSPLGIVWRLVKVSILFRPRIFQAILNCGSRVLRETTTGAPFCSAHFGSLIFCLGEV